MEGRRVDGLRLPAAADLLPHRLPAESPWRGVTMVPPGSICESRLYMRQVCSCSFATSMATKLRSVVLPRDLVHGTRGRDRAGRGREENSPEENERPGDCIVVRVLRAGVPIQYKASTSKGSHLCKFHIATGSFLATQEFASKTVQQWWLLFPTTPTTSWSGSSLVLCECGIRLQNARDLALTDEPA